MVCVIKGKAEMAMLVTTFYSVAAIYMPDITDVLRGIFGNFPYNHRFLMCKQKC
jgi:hypothetical protein